MYLADLKEKLNYLKSEDLKLIEKAYKLAKKAHEGQERYSGAPFIEHEFETALFVANLKLDAKAVAAALLHDVCEDTYVSINDIKKNFGKDVAQIVDGVTKLGKIRITRKWLVIKDEKELKEFDRQVETLRKMLVAMSKDIRVIIIKLADRYHNMKTLDAVPKEKQFRIAKETLEIYAPLAYRLGMGELKGQLEDMAFSYIYPEEYKELKEKVDKRIKEKEKYIEDLRKDVLKKLAKIGIRAEVHGRAKHLYSLWRKMKRNNNDLNQIYDLVALRVIVGSLDECYKVLGLIHETWKPLVGRIKDYISTPKQNGYQSLHTTVFGPKGEIVEIQIRTKLMHDHAENGIAAHWHYSEHKTAFDYLTKQNGRVPYKDLVWVRELNSWQKALKSNKEVAESLAMDFFSDRIFIYTHQGDVKDLPVGSTPVDFSYAVHTDIGHRTAGAKVNGKIVNLEHHLANGDIVEIITNKNGKPKRDWLDFVKTSLARSRIKSYLNK